MNREIVIPEGYEARIEGNKVIIELKESEDERIRKWIISDITENLGNYNSASINMAHKALAYLEKQKEQKPAEWSKEDEKKFELLLTCVCRCINDSRVDYEERKQISKKLVPFIERLKSLRLQPHWKPSSLELSALRTAINILTEERYFPRAGKHLQDILDHFEGKETRHDWKPSEEQANKCKKCIDGDIVTNGSLCFGCFKKESL